MLKLSNIIRAANFYYDLIIKNSFIKTLSNGQCRVVSRKGKTLGTFGSKASINYIDLSHLEELSYSSIMRELKKQSDTETITNFCSIFKQIFDQLFLQELENPAEKALPLTLMVFCKLHPVKLMEK